MFQDDIRWPLCSTPIQVPVLAAYLRAHPDREFVQFLLEGLQTGFRIGYVPQPGKKGLRAYPGNRPSVEKCPAAVTQYISNECLAGRMVGPLSETLSESIHCSPIGLVPKGHNTGKWRMIVDLSCLAPRSVNDGINADLCSHVFGYG